MPLSPHTKAHSHFATCSALTGISAVRHLAVIYILSKQRMSMLARHFCLTCGTSPLAAISHIVSLRPIEKMGWVKTWRSVTRMTDILLFFNRHPLPRRIRKAMHSKPLAMIAHHSIAMIVNCACPDPTAVNGINNPATEQPFFKRQSCYLLVTHFHRMNYTKKRLQVQHNNAFLLGAVTINWRVVR